VTTQWRRSRWNWVLDISLLAGFATTNNKRFTGDRWHEWIGVALLFALGVHIVLHRQWVTTQTRRLGKNVKTRVGFKWLVNLSLYVLISLTLFSGVLATKFLASDLGISYRAQQGWGGFHRQCSDLVKIPVGLHVALSWRWIWSMLRRIARRITPTRQAPGPVSA
jgi:hypothetical protein